MADMKTVVLSERSKHNLLHIEAPGCIINVQIGLTDAEGRPVTHVSVSANGDRYAGDPEWWGEGQHGNKGVGVRIIRTTNPHEKPD